MILGRRSEPFQRAGLALGALQLVLAIPRIAVGHARTTSQQRRSYTGLGKPSPTLLLPEGSPPALRGACGVWIARPTVLSTRPVSRAPMRARPSRVCLYHSFACAFLSYDFESISDVVFVRVNFSQFVVHMNGTVARGWESLSGFVHCLPWATSVRGGV